jgi:hypothetical protein
MFGSALRQFPAKSEVFLAGGPHNQNTPGLPVGQYFFQVTDPTGATLLSDDPVACRQVLVSVPPGFTQGAITAAGPAPFGPGGGDCAHNAAGYDPSTGSTGVHLMPFEDTSSPSRVYKVWLIPSSACNGVPGVDLSCNFTDANSKTVYFQITSCTGLSCQSPPPATIAGSVQDLSLGSWFASSYSGLEVEVKGTQLGYPFSTWVFTATDGTWSARNLDRGTQVTACIVVAGQGAAAAPTAAGVSGSERLICRRATAI